MRSNTLIKRIIIYFFLVLAAFLLETCIFPMLEFLSAAPNLLLIITFSYGFIYGSMTGIICGVFAGLLADMFYMHPIGMFIIIFSCIGFFCGIFKDQLRNDQIWFPMVLCFLSEVFYNVIIYIYKFLANGSVDVEYAMLHVTLPEVFFSLLITLVAYRIVLHTNRRMDSIDKIRGKNVA